MHAKVRHDAWGFGDLLACIPGVGITLLQVTTTTNMVARQNKIQGECWEDAQRWLSYPGAAVEVWGWAKRGPRGKRKLWSLKRRRLVEHVATTGDQLLTVASKAQAADPQFLAFAAPFFPPTSSWHWLEISEDSPADLALTEQEP